MVLGGFLWLLSGVLTSLGLVGYFTGLLLLPLGVGLAVYAGRSYRSSWPWLIPGMGVGPVVLLSGDVMSDQPSAGAVPILWTGVALLVLGTLGSTYVSWKRRSEQAAEPISDGSR